MDSSISPSPTTTLALPSNSIASTSTRSASIATPAPAAHVQQQDGAGSKRKRVALACNACRVRKSKCDGMRPKCSNCKDLDFDCVYAQSASSSNTIVAKDYIGQLESRLLAVEKMLATQLERQEARSHPKRQKRSHSGNNSSDCGSAGVSDEEQQQSASSPGDDDAQAMAKPSRKKSRKLKDTDLAHRGSTDSNNVRRHDEIQDETKNGLVTLKVEKLEDDEEGLGNGVKEVILDGMGTLGSGSGDEEDYGYFGPSSNIAFLSHVTRALASSSLSSGSSLSQPGLHSSYTAKHHSPSLPRRNCRQEINSNNSDTLNIYVLPPSEQVLHYIDLYFQNTNILFPYLHQQTFLAQYREVEASGFTKVRRTWLALLNIVMAMGCKATSPSHTDDSDEDIAETFYLRAMGIVQDSFLKLASLEAVQMLLLMSHYLQSTRKPVQCWHTHGLAIRVALQLGLQSNRALARFGLLERELRKRAWHGCVLLDKTLCMTFGRPTSIGPYAYELELPLDVEDEELMRAANSPQNSRSVGADSSEAEENIRSHTLSTSVEAICGKRRTAVTTTTFFIMAIKLYKILGRIIDCLYNGNLGDQISPDHPMSSPIRLPSCAFPTFSDFSYLSEIEAMLSQWRAELPLPLSIISAKDIPAGGGPASKFWRQSIILSLRYYNIRSLLHRPFIVKGLSEIRGGGPSSSSSFEGEFYWKYGWPAVKTCAESAGEIVKIVYRLLSDRRKELLAWWWFSLYYTFNASLVVISKLVIVRQLGGLIVRSGDGIAVHSHFPRKFQSTNTDEHELNGLHGVGSGKRRKGGTMTMPFGVEGVCEEKIKLLLDHLEMARKAIEVLAEGNRIAERLKEFMKGLMKVVLPLARVDYAGGRIENDEEKSRKDMREALGVGESTPHGKNKNSRELDENSMQLNAGSPITLGYNGIYKENQNTQQGQLKEITPSYSDFPCRRPSTPSPKHRQLMTSASAMNNIRTNTTTADDHCLQRYRRYPYIASSASSPNQLSIPSMIVSPIAPSTGPFAETGMALSPPQHPSLDTLYGRTIPEVGQSLMTDLGEEFMLESDFGYLSRLLPGFEEGEGDNRTGEMVWR